MKPFAHKNYLPDFNGNYCVYLPGQDDWLDRLLQRILDWRRRRRLRLVEEGYHGRGFRYVMHKSSPSVKSIVKK